MYKTELQMRLSLYSGINILKKHIGEKEMSPDEISKFTTLQLIEAKEEIAKKVREKNNSLKQG